MAIVETTTIRVRRSTHERLTKEAELEGKSVTQIVEEAMDMLEEVRILESAKRAWQRMGELPDEVVAASGALTDEEIAQIESKED
ncbi:MAG TPA: hypothetical protein VMS60_00845 [Solirubrobacterales bacterium]|nr:hypothetical protein [Solirubrobacterales bacterium]